MMKLAPLLKYKTSSQLKKKRKQRKFSKSKAAIPLSHLVSICSTKILKKIFHKE